MKSEIIDLKDGRIDVHVKLNPSEFKRLFNFGGRQSPKPVRQVIIDVEE
jgi:hypothetical protein